MYLSRLVLNPRHARAARDMRAPYELHRTLMRAFLQTPKEMERVLFRLEQSPRFGKVTVWLQSHTAPDWSFLNADEWRGYLAAEAVANPDTRVFDPQLETGMRLNFRLLANPTIKRKNKDGKPARHRIASPEQQHAWLRAKFAQGGAAMGELRVTTQGDCASFKKEDGKLTHYAVLFEGELRVDAPETFARLMAEGVGSAKGFGFGLLSLARA